MSREVRYVRAADLRPGDIIRGEETVEQVRMRGRACQVSVRRATGEKSIIIYESGDTWVRILLDGP